MQLRVQAAVSHAGAHPVRRDNRLSPSNASSCAVSASSHLNNFNLLRLLAAVAVLFSHGEFLYRTQMPVPFAGHSLGSVAVYVFFFVSGYLVTQSWARNPSVLGFTARRVGRIYPGLIVSVVFSVAVVGALMTTWPQADYWRAGLTWANLANNALGLSTVQVLPGVFEHNPFARAVNGSLWTIRYELMMYALLVGVSCLGIKLHRQLYLLAVLILGASWLLVMGFDWPNQPSWFPAWLRELWSARDFTSLGVYFFMGAVVAQLDVRGRAALAALGLVGAAALVLASRSASPVLVQLGLWVGIPGLTFCLAHLGSSWLRGRPHADLSYGVYIYAFPIQQAITQVSLARGWSLAVCLGLSLLLTVLMAAFSWFCVEKPGIAATRRWLAHRPQG